jgi:hypothetical protein
MALELHIYQDFHELPDSCLLFGFLDFLIRTVLNLQDSWKICTILVYPGLRTNCATQPLFGDIP